LGLVIDGSSKGQQHEVLHDVLAFHAQQQWGAVNESNVWPKQQHEKCARQMECDCAQNDWHPAAEQKPAPSTTSNAPTTGTVTSGSRKGDVAAINDAGKIGSSSSLSLQTK
jgi:hypothetical protein